MAKPTPKRIPSDGCAVVIDGEVCYPHEGEWVDLICSETVGELRARVALGRLTVELEEIEGDEQEGYKRNQIYDRYYTVLREHLARRIAAWSWTDDFGELLPQPRGEPDALLRLRSGELWWLMNATAPRETEAERKND